MSTAIIAFIIMLGAPSIIALAAAGYSRLAAIDTAMCFASVLVWYVHQRRMWMRHDAELKRRLGK